jgi:hypothetical protein
MLGEQSGCPVPVDIFTANRMIRTSADEIPAVELSESGLADHCHAAPLLNAISAEYPSEETRNPGVIAVPPARRTAVSPGEISQSTTTC